MKLDELKSVLEEHGLAEYYEKIRAQYKPCIWLRLGEAGEGKIGTSRIGGRPDLPDGMEWPTSNETLPEGDKGTPLTFVMQIDLADIPDDKDFPRSEIHLPKDGLLSVFIGLDEPATDVEHRFFLIPAGIPLSRKDIPESADFEDDMYAEMPPHGLKLVLGADFPRWATDDQQELCEAMEEEAGEDCDVDDLFDAYTDFTNDLEPCHSKEIVGKLLGHAAGIGSDPREDAYVVREVNPEWLYEYTKRATLDMSLARRWQNLLMLDSCDALNLTIWDAGYLQFLIREDKLKDGDFGGCYAHVESS